MSVFGTEDIVPFARAANEWAQKVLGSNPPELCDETSDLLSIGLHWLGITGLERMTSYIPNSGASDHALGHVWLRWHGDIAIDATTGQFPDQFGVEVFIVRHSEWHNNLREKRPPIPIDTNSIRELRTKHSRARSCFEMLLRERGIQLESKLIFEDRPITIWRPRTSSQS